MILVDEFSKEKLYSEKPYIENMENHELYRFSQCFKKNNDKDTIYHVIIYLSSIANDYDVKFEDMLFGGTEKEILNRKLIEMFIKWADIKSLSKFDATSILLEKVKVYFVVN